MKNYNIKIVFENGATMTSNCEAEDLEEVSEIYLENKVTCTNNGKKLVYYSKEKIMMLEANEIEDK